MGGKPRPKSPECDCAERLEEWYKFSLFGGIVRDVPEEMNNKEVWLACLAYMVRQLSHRRIPHMELVRDTLLGKLPVPPCGFIGCTWDAEHVH